MNEDKEIFNEENLVRWLNGDISPEEQRILEADEIAKEKFNAYRHIWNASGQLTSPSGRTSQSRLEVLHARMDQPGSRLRFLSSVWRYAAVVLLVIVAGVMLFRLQDKPDLHYITSAPGTIKTIELPDHSLVTLNGGSSLEYDAALWDRHRKVKLAGEAYFDVKHVGTPFIVVDDKAQVSVLGTTFSIRSLNETTRVACLTGKVEVKEIQNSDRSLILTPGSGTDVMTGKEKLVSYSIDPVEVVGWKDGKLYFSNTPLREVFVELERFFGKTILLTEDVPNVRYSGRFDHPEWNNVINAVCLSASITYTVQSDSTITVP